jgi:hypothetical protein
LQAGAVIRREHLALDDREVNFIWLSQLACLGVRTMMIRG